MSDKFKDFDLELDDIKGVIRQAPLPPDNTPLTEAEVEKLIAEEAPAEKLPMDDDYASVVTRLTKHCDRAWIAIPKGEKIEVHEIGKCTGTQFYEWLKWAYPPVATLEYRPDLYDAKANQINAIMNLSALMDKCVKVFKHYGLSSEMSAKEKKGGK